jgi:protein-disulfide isomerase
MRDLATNRNAIDALLGRNHAQAIAFGFQGTPAFIIGHFRIPGALDPETFKQAIMSGTSSPEKPEESDD